MIDAEADAESTTSDVTYRIPNVAIYIPGIHSRVRFAPRYVLRLYQAKWKGAIPDPMDPVRVIAFPAGMEVARYHEVRASSEEEAIEIESARLRIEFGLHEKSGEPLFDVIYPADTFMLAFKTARASQPEKVSANTSSLAEKALAALDGVGPAMAKKLITIGLTTVEAVAFVDLDELTRALGKLRAAKAQTAALAAIKPDEDVIATKNLPVSGE